MFTNAFLPKDVKTASRPSSQPSRFDSYFCEQGHFAESCVFAFELFSELFFFFLVLSIHVFHLNTILSNFHLWCFCREISRFSCSATLGMTNDFPQFFHLFLFASPTIDPNSVKYRFHTWLTPPPPNKLCLPRIFLKFSSAVPLLFTGVNLLQLDKNFECSHKLYV